MRIIHPAYSLIPIVIGVLTIAIYTNTKIFGDHNPLWLGILSACATLYIFFVNYINKFGNVIAEFKDEHLEQLKAATTSGRFYKVEAAKGLMHITKNISNYSKIYNIRVRPKGEKQSDLADAGDLWRSEVFRMVGEGAVKIKEIVANHDVFINDAIELLRISENLPGANKYECRRTIAKPKDLQIRNFMLLESRHPKGKGKLLELYWGWHSVNGDDTVFLTYYTTDRAMTRDYHKRFNDMFKAAKDIQIT